MKMNLTLHLKDIYCFFLLFLLISTHTLVAQSPGFAWANGAPGTTNAQSVGQAVAKLSSGNMIVAGTFQDTIILGSHVLHGVYKNGNGAGFIAEYGAGGNVIWAKSFAAGSSNVITKRVSGVTVDGNDNIFVTGNWSSQDTLWFDNISLAGSGTGFFGLTQGSYLAKYDHNGNAMWVNYLDAYSIYGICTDAINNIYLTGATWAFVGSTFGTHDTIKESAFVTRFDNNGNYNWVKGFGQKVQGIAANTFPYGITCDSQDSLIISGESSDTLTMGATTIVPIDALARVFTAKLDTAGNFIWAHAATGAAGSAALAVTTDNSDNIFITGFFGGSGFGNSGPMVLDTFSLTNYSSAFSQYFIVKMNSAGNILWAKHDLNGNNSGGYAIAADDTGNVYTFGFYHNAITFGMDTENANGLCNTFAAKFKGSGQYEWMAAGGELNGGGDLGNGMALDNNNNLYVTGSIADTAMFGSITVTPSGSIYNYFIAKIGSSLSTGNIAAPLTAVGVQIYPNPATVQITITVDKELIGGKAELSDMLGHQIKVWNVEKTTTSVELPNLTAGLYMVHVSSQGKADIGKLVVK